eukprot:3631441-Pyramimonas_sp.AAC.1
MGASRKQQRKEQRQIAWHVCALLVPTSICPHRPPRNPATCSSHGLSARARGSRTGTGSRRSEPAPPGTPAR